jgi:hypothetical protein
MRESPERRMLFLRADTALKMALEDGERGDPVDYIEDSDGDWIVCPLVENDTPYRTRLRGWAPQVITMEVEHASEPDVTVPLSDDGGVTMSTRRLRVFMVREHSAMALGDADDEFAELPDATVSFLNRSLRGIRIIPPPDNQPRLFASSVDLVIEELE